jgi:hypothetical protein
MAARGGLTAAALLARQLAHKRQVQQDQKQVAAQKTANDPAAWTEELKRAALDKEAKQEARERGMAAAFAETERAQATLEKLSAKMRRLGLDHEALPEDALAKVGELLSKAGMRPKSARGPVGMRDTLRYLLLEAMIAVKDQDEAMVLNTCVYPVKEILDHSQESVVLIVTLKGEVQCSKNQVVFALKQMGEDVRVADVHIRTPATSTSAKTSGKAGKTFAPTIEIKLQGGGGLNPGISEAIKTRHLEFTTEEGSRISGTVTVRSMHALEIHFNAQERMKIKLMWDILEILGLEAEGLNSLLTSSTRRGLEKVGLDEGLMCVRVIADRRIGDKVEPLQPSDISKMPQYGGTLFLAYFATREARDRVEAMGALVSCWLGKEELECIVLACGQIKESAAEKVQEVGIEAARKALQARVEAQYAAPGQLVEKVNNLLNWASGDGVSQDQLAKAMLNLYLGKECRRGSDVTADFLANVVREMSKELQATMPEEQYRTALQRYREWLKEAQEEVTRRRNILGPVTLVRLAKLQTPDIKGEAKRQVLGRVYERAVLTKIVEEWLRKSLMPDGKQFLVAEPVLKQKERSVFWDLEAGVLIAAQDLHQLVKGEIFDSNGDWRAARAQTMPQEAGLKVEVSVLVFDKGKRYNQQVSGIINQSSAPTPFGGERGSGGSNPPPSEATRGALGAEVYHRRERQPAASELHSAGPGAGHPYERIATAGS